MPKIYHQYCHNAFSSCEHYCNSNIRPITMNCPPTLKRKQDLERNKAIQEQLAARAAHGKLIQMIAQHCEKNYQGEVDYHFTFANKVKRIAINEQTQLGLINGALAICVLNEEFYLINKEAASKLREIDDSVLVSLHDNVEISETEAEDPYAEFAIPDDIMW